MWRLPSVARKSVGGKLCNESLETAHNGRLAGRGFYSLIREVEQNAGMEAGRKALQAHRGHDPVAVATRPFKQVHLAGNAVYEDLSQLIPQRGVTAGRCCQSRFQCTCFVSHFPSLMCKVLNRGLSSPAPWYLGLMSGENRIIAFGTGGSDSKAEHPEDTQTMASAIISAPAVEEHGENWSQHSVWDGAATSRPEWLLPAMAAAAAVAWTGFFIAARMAQFRTGLTVEAVPQLTLEWGVPILLIGVLWLLVLRHSTREGRRFGHIARTLSAESALLEKRLVTVNRELSLAREFIASQSRDLESLGRIAVERISENAGRLQDLIRDNSARVDSISSVSHAALENMEKLRGQLPVIASSAKDVTNNIGNAGRAAHAQLEDMISGFSRLNEFGTASERQVQTLRSAVETTLDEFAAQCAKFDELANNRFAALAERGEAFRTQLDKDEIEVLAAIRTRASTLAEEIERSRGLLDKHEAESLTSLRARLAALRDESEVFSRALRSAEGRAVDEWKAALEELRSASEETSSAITETQKTALEALASRTSEINAEAARLDETLTERAQRLSEESAALLGQQEAREREAVEHFRATLAEFDSSMAERLDRHRAHVEALRDTTGAITNQLGEFESRLTGIVEHTAQGEEMLSVSLGLLDERLSAAHATLAATGGDLERLTVDSGRLLELMQASAEQASNALPDALSAGEDRLGRLHEGLGSFLEALQQAGRDSEALAGEISSSGAHLHSLIEALSSGHAAIAEQGSKHANLLAELRAAVDGIESAAGRTADKAGSELRSAIQTLDAAIIESVESIETESAARIASVAQTLGKESAEAIEKAMRPRVAEVSGQLEQAVAHAAGATREATIQLREQLAKVDELVVNLENRVAYARRRAEEEVDNDFSRRVALITESLNSHAIDIASALSTDVADTAWAAYLRGDRGIFTRRAVRLLEPGEAKSIQQIFERDDAFREYVSRYIHDFEAILRQVLSTRDGNALGVTLLSSDMGKLYVALAQAIERLRS